MRSKFIAAVSVACGALVLAGTAFAGDPPYFTNVTIKEQNGDFHGKVIVEHSSCLADRKVTVLKKRDGKDLKINSDTTDEAGKWNTGNTHVGKGRYYARASAVFKAKGKGTTPYCEKGRSKTVVVD